MASPPPLGPKPLNSGPVRTLPYKLSMWLLICVLYHILYNAPGTGKQRLAEFCELCQQMIEPQEGVEGTFDLQPAGQKHG